MIFPDRQHTDEVAALMALASQGSFAAAARQLQRHPTIVSKRIAAMEARLGVRLVARNTRQVRLTEAGARLAERLRQATDLMSEAEEEAASGTTEVRGHLRLAVPAAMGRLWLAPRLPAFLAAHPQLTLLVEYSERYVDVVGEGFDLAVRIGELQDSRLVARRLGDHSRILCAAPAYLERRGYPQCPADLAGHDCLSFTGLADYPDWPLFSGKLQSTIRPRGSLVSNDSEALLSAALAGIGILGAGSWLFSAALAQGRLIRVLPEWVLGAGGGIYLVQPSSRFPTAATQALKLWLQAQLQAQPLAMPRA